MKQITETQRQELIDYLEGSSKSLSEACNDLFEADDDILTQEDREAIDAQIHNCATCGWWSESGSEDDEGNCEECSNDEDREDE